MHRDASKSLRNPGLLTMTAMPISLAAYTHLTFPLRREEDGSRETMKARFPPAETQEQQR